MNLNPHKSKALRLVAAALALALTTLVVAPNALAAPPAGATISNQASATFNDSGGFSHTVFSNVVTTTVTQIAGVTADPDQTLPAAAGSQVEFPVTITNDGNGSDFFLFGTADAGTFAMVTVEVYPDVDGNGIPDPGPAITQTPALAAGATYDVVVVGTIPPGALAGQTNTITLTATSNFDGGVSDTALLTTNITANAVIEVTKSMSALSGNPGSGPHTVTIQYRNTGATPATAVNLVDTLPAGMNYVAGSGRWSATGATVLTDASDGVQGTVPNTIDYSFAGGVVTALVSTVPVGGAIYTVTFQVTIDAAATAGPAPNTVAFDYNDGAAAVGPFNSNTVNFNVNQIYGVVATGATIPVANQGATVDFSNTVQNTGNGTDSFTVTIGADTFPAGTGFQLLNAALAPFPGTTAALAPGAIETVVLRVTLPPGATGGPYTVIKNVASVGNPATTDTATDTLTAIVTSTVDVTNDAGLTLGAGAGPEGAPVLAVQVNPGASVTIPLFLNNTSAVADSYNLAASTDSTFGAVTLPPGWSVVFQNLAAVPITNSGPVPAAGQVQVNAIVTPPAGTPPTGAPGTSIYFRALSPTTLASDRIHDAVEVNTLRAMALVPTPQTLQAFPGGFIDFAHQLVNNGNVAESGGASTITLSSVNSQAGFTSAIYIDADASGTVTAGDTLVTGPADVPAVPAGGSINLVVRVTVPAAATLGTTNLTTVSTVVAGAINGVAAPAVANALDTTQVSESVALVKEQAIDANCDGTPDVAYTQAAISAAPAECIRYRITATNNAATAVTAVVISDSTPAFTFHHTAGGGAPAAVTVGAISQEPADGGTGLVEATVGTLNPSQSAVLTFGVLVEP